MLKGAWLKVFSVFLVISVNAAYAGGPEYAPTSSSTSGFNQIHAEGYVDVIIHSAAHASVSVATNSSEPVETHVHQHTLYIQAPWTPLPELTKHRPMVTVNVADLTKLVVHGPANVAGVKVHAQGLTIIADGSGKIKLIGVMKVNRIQQAGSNRIYLRWLNGGTLLINSTGAGLIYLGGIANTVYARLYDHAILNAQYLRAGVVQVQTKNQAAAYVYPVTSLRAFASDQSNIYYYKYPKNLTRDTSQSGNVLQMAWRP